MNVYISLYLLVRYHASIEQSCRKKNDNIPIELRLRGEMRK